MLTRTLAILLLTATPALAIQGQATVIDGDTIEIHGERIRPRTLCHYFFSSRFIISLANSGMKSTLYAVKRLDNLEGKAIAVLVVEAMNSNHFTESQLRDTINGSINDYARVIHELRAYVSNPAKAEESGL